jgi:hypothetical protein
VIDIVAAAVGGVLVRVATVVASVWSVHVTLVVPVAVTSARALIE